MSALRVGFSSLFVLLLLAVQPTVAQEERPSGPDSKEEQESNQWWFPEVEAVGSDEFRSVSYVQPIIRGLRLEGHYFGEEADIGAVGGSWDFRLGEHVVLSPGLGVLFGSRQATAPAFTFRWAIEKEWFVSEGMLVQALRETEDTLTSVWDSNHASLRWKRLEIGPSWEYIQFRGEVEWKWGGRAAVRLTPHISGVLFVLAPGKTEFRGGIILHPGGE